MRGKGGTFRDQNSIQNEGRGGRGVFSGLSLLLVGAAAGSLTAYFLDPVQGRRRRATARDQGMSLVNGWLHSGRRLAVDLMNRSQGHFARLLLPKGARVEDRILISRVRSGFGRKVSHPKAVHVEAQNGVIILSGHILADELDDLLRAVEEVEGVEEVRNHLEAHPEAGNIPSLQGEGPDYLH